MSALLSSLFATLPGRRVEALVDGDRHITGTIALARRIAVLGVDGGSGASTLSTAVASTLAARRRGPVLLVDAHGSSGATLTDAGFPDYEQHCFVRESSRRARPRTAADAQHGLPATDDGLWGLDLGAASAHDHRPGLGEWTGQVGPIARFYDLVVSDFGRRGLDEAERIAAVSHCTCVTTRADREHLVRAATAARSLQAAGHRVVLAVSDIDARHHATAVDLLTRDLKVVQLPRDNARRTHRSMTGRPSVPGQATRNAVVALTAALVRSAKEAA